MSSNITSVGHIPLEALKPEYLKLLTDESQQIIKFLKGHYHKLDINQHPIPTVLLNWFKDTAMNYQNILHTMNISKYTVTKVEEKILSGDKTKAYQENFEDDYSDTYKDGTKVKVKTKGFTNFQTFGGPIGQQQQMQSMQIPDEWQKFLKMPTKDELNRKKMMGGGHNNRRFSRAKSMFRNFGDMKKYENKVDFLKDTNPYLIKALLHLYKQYLSNQSSSKLQIILNQYYNNQLENQKKIISTLEQIQNKQLNLVEMEQWLNNDAKLLVRGFSSLLSNGQVDLPYELMKRMKRNTHLYNEFFPLVIQDYVEKRLNKRYVYTVTLPNYRNNNTTGKLELEVLSKSYFEPIEFPVFFKTKPSGNEEYQKFIKEQQTVSTQDKVRRRKNISFMLARFMLIQSLHLPWIIKRDMNATIYLTSFKKQLQPSSNPMLGSKEINSASCYNNKFIYIWRKEELSKSIIHESVHHANLDKESDVNLDEFIKQNMAIDESTELRLYESYTETCAMLINIMTSVYEMFLIHHKWNNYATQLKSHFEYNQSQLQPQPRINNKSNSKPSDIKYLPVEKVELNNKGNRSKNISYYGRKFERPHARYDLPLIKPKPKSRKSKIISGKLKSNLKTKTISKRKLLSGKSKSRSGKSKSRSGLKSKSRTRLRSKSKIRSKSKKFSRSNSKSKKSRPVTKTRRHRRSYSGGSQLTGYSLDLKAVIGEVKKIFMVLIRLEQLFASFQVAKILNHFGFKTFNEFLHPQDTTKRLKQKTSVVSYFIIKGGFINSITKFVGFINNMNPSQSEPVMNIKFKPNNQNEFKQLITECVIKNVGYHNTVDAFLEHIRSEGIYPKQPSSSTEFGIEKTLRMTVTEVSDEIYS